MNKYEEALSKLLGVDLAYYFASEDVQPLFELVERATPMFTDNTECPNCGGWNAESEEYFTPYKFCPDCGQALKRVK